MKAERLLKKTVEELSKLKKELQVELSKMLVQKAAASVGEGFSKTHLIKEIRREIARVSFIISVKI